MTDLQRISGLDINQDMEYQWREWRVHRIAWVVFAAIILAGLLGLLGQGPLSTARIGEANGPLALKYERIDRYAAPTTMQVMLGANPGSGGKARVAFSRDFMDRISVDGIIPEPAESETGADEVVYTFDIQDPAQPTVVRLDFEHERIGPLRGVVRLEGGPQLEFTGFVWP